MGISLAIEWVRFGLRTPSLVDDWFGITYSRRAFEALLHGDYSSSQVDFAGRYRPSYTAIWNYAQWHLFGGPSVTVAAAWGVLRVALFLVAVWLLATWLVEQRSVPRSRSLWLAPLVVAMTPAITVDLVRYSPAEPLMVTGLIIGLALFGAGAHKLLLGRGAPTRAVALMAAGYAVYVVGVYSKETSVCLLAFAPFFLKWLGPPIRTRILESRRGRSVFTASAVLLVAPLVDVGVHLALSVSGGRDPYPNAHFSLGRKVLAAGVLPLIGAPGPLGTLLWLVGAPAAIAVAAVVARRHERDAWLLLGVLATGFLMAAFSLARGDTPSRYYIPWIVAVAAVGLRGLVRAHPGFQIAVVAILVGVVFSGTWEAVGDWARTERSGSAAVEMSSGVVRAGCPLYLANFDVERRVAIPRLLDFGQPTAIRRCTHGSDQVYALSWQKESLPPELATRCRSGWDQLEVRNRVSLYRCRSFTAGSFADQDAASSSPLVAVVRLRLQGHAPSPRTLFQPSPSGGAG